MSLAEKRPQTEDALTAFFGSVRPTRWVTRERPKIDRIACPWAMRRFIDREAEIIYAPPSEVFAVAETRGALAFDIPGAPITHEGERCSFDTLIARFGLQDPALEVLSLIVRGADTERHALAPEAAGLHAISLGLSRNYSNDLAMLEQGMIIYDALYAWASGTRQERHDWKPGSQ